MTSWDSTAPPSMAGLEGSGKRRGEEVEPGKLVGVIGATVDTKTGGAVRRSADGLGRRGMGYGAIDRGGWLLLSTTAPSGQYGMS
jgi:hypothetical protein